MQWQVERPIDDAKALERIIRDGGIDILSSGYWCDINSPKIRRVFIGTEEDIPTWRGSIY